jgi:hypothetical protein
VDEELGREEDNRFLKAHNARLREWMSGAGIDAEVFDKAYPLNPPTERRDIAPTDEEGKAIPLYERFQAQAVERAAEAENWKLHGGALSPETADQSLAEFQAATTPVGFGEVRPVPGSRASGMRIGDEDGPDGVPFDSVAVRAELASLPGMEGEALESALQRLNDASSLGRAAMDHVVGSIVWADT